MRVPGLPLLTRELLQQSGRRRTWITRTLVLAGMLFFFLMLSQDIWTTDVFVMLGRGGEMFQIIVGLQFFGVYVLVPLMSYSLITGERERDSLSLLLLTRLGPWTILFEKLLSPLAGVVLFLLAALPFHAVAYSMGGIGPTALICAVWSLCVTAFHCASVSLMCSSIARTSTQAFLGTVVIGIAITAGPPILNWFVLENIGWGMNTLPYFSSLPDPEWLLTGPYLYFEAGGSIDKCVGFSIPMIVISLCCLVVGRAFLVRQTLGQGIGLGRRAIRGFRAATDTVLVFEDPNSDGRQKLDLPGDQPVAWMSCTKSTIGAGRHQFVLAGLAAGGLILLNLLMISVNHLDADAFATMMLVLLWPVSILTVCGRAAGLFGYERTRQTLDILLTTPMSSREIVRQKMKSVTRLILVFMSLFAIQHIFLAITIKHRDSNAVPMLLSLFAALITPTVYLPLFGWLACGTGIRAKTAARATVRCVLIITGWSFLPLLMGICGGGACLVGSDESVFVVFLISPATFVFASIGSCHGMFGHSQFGLFIAMLLLNTAGYGVGVALFRNWCLMTADIALNRAGPLRPDERPPRPAGI